MILNKKIPFQYLANKIKWDMIVVTIFSFIVYYTSRHFFEIHIPLGIGAFLGTAIAILISFKVNQSYERWWESRKIWGAIVNDSRSLVVQLKNFLGEKHNEAIRKVALRQIAWCYTLGQSLRKEDPYVNIDQFISNDEMKSLQNHSNVPLGIMDLHSRDVALFQRSECINDFQQIQLDSTITRLVASMGKAERINNTVFPKSYRITLRFSFYVFLVSLSLSLTELHSFVEVPIMVFVSIPFFMLEKIALHIQDPYQNMPNDTPVTSLARTIEGNIRNILDMEVPSEPLVPQKEEEDFYAL